MNECIPTVDGQKKWLSLSVSGIYRYWPLMDNIIMYIIKYPVIMHMVIVINSNSDITI